MTTWRVESSCSTRSTRRERRGRISSQRITPRAPAAPVPATAVAAAGDPAAMAEAFALAIRAGQLAAQSGPMEPRDMAAPSTPLLGKAFLG